MKWSMLAALGSVAFASYMMMRALDTLREMDEAISKGWTYE